MICPIPLEFTSCRTALSLRDSARVLGCRTSSGSIANVEIVALESGPAKARAASATVAGISQFQPDIVMDSGTCAALDGDLIVNSIVLGLSCLEFDISGSGLPARIIPEMRLPSALQIIPRREAQKLARSAAELGNSLGQQVRSGVSSLRRVLHPVRPGAGVAPCRQRGCRLQLGDSGSVHRRPPGQGAAPQPARHLGLWGRGLHAGFPQECPQERARAVSVRSRGGGVRVAHGFLHSMEGFEPRPG